MQSGRDWPRVLALLPLLFALAASRGAFAATGTPIESCQTIDASGLYEVVADLTVSSGDCLVVNAPGVILELNGHAISGGGSGIAGIGIHITGAAHNFILAGHSAVISNFMIGIEDDAPGAWGGDFNLENNDSGLMLVGANDSIFYNYASEDNSHDGTDLVSTSGAQILGSFNTGNKKFGVLMAGSSHNILDFFTSHRNRTANVELASLPTFSNQRTKGAPSSFNLLVDSAISGSTFGIAILNQSSQNLVAEMGLDPARPAIKKDYFDGNPGCDHDLWLENEFSRARSSCIKR